MRASILLAALAAGLGLAQYHQINELSFGLSSKLGTDEHPQTIPHFAINGHPNQPDVLSNKAILTPMGIGNQRSSIWSEYTLQHPSWVADLDFRTNGPQRAGGNFNIWLVKDGRSVVGENSIYTVGRFEGLALVIDQYGGSGGMLRGFLNDGSQDYAQQSNIDALAFGHCQIAYRNLGRLSQVKIKHTASHFEVSVDNNLCFESDKIAIPQGYNFGISAATPENPDSFEVYKLLVTYEASDTYQTQHQHQQQPLGGNHDHSEEVFNNNIRDENADSFKTSHAQFADLHDRLQSTHHDLAAIYHSITDHAAADGQRHKEVQEMVQSMRNDLRRLDSLDSLQRTVSDLQREVASLRDQLDRRISSHETSFRGALSDHHHQLSERLMKTIPGHGKLIAIFIGTQVLLALVYIVYKRRKLATPKKYL